MDTNILLRISRRTDPEYAVAHEAVAALARKGATLYYTHQNIAEFWNVMTRPVSRNGLGLTSAEAEREVQTIEEGMSLLPESQATYREWRRLVLLYDVQGAQVHDARLAAAVLVNSVHSILTFNTGDFSRYAGVMAIHPKAIISGSRP